jgi:hypothetical protein
MKASELVAHLTAMVAEHLQVGPQSVTSVSLNVSRELYGSHVSVSGNARRFDPKTNLWQELTVDFLIESDEDVEGAMKT